MAQAFGISRSSLYKPNKPKSDNGELPIVIKQLFDASRQEYGAKRIHRGLEAMCHTISLYQVRKLMKQLGLAAKARRKFKVTTKQSKRPHYVAPNRLNRNFTTSKPNEAWVTDITYVHTQEGWLYVATALDLFSRRVVGLAMSLRLKTDLVLRATLQAIKHRKPKPGLILQNRLGSKGYIAGYQA